MIHEIFPHQFNNQYLANKNINDDDIILYFEANSVLLKADGDDCELPRRKDFPEISLKTESIFLFTLNGNSCFLVFDNLNVDESSFEFKDISFFRTARKQEVAWVSIVGFHLMTWYSHNKFCGKCGAKTHFNNDERSIICPVCNTTVYPKISPAIIVAIVCNDKILLARNSNFSGGWYSLVAGYADVGESLEETLIREVKEEVGLDVKNIRYYKSQPWPLSGSMMIGFVAEADDSQPICIDGKEITDAAWFSKGNLPPHPMNISIAGEMIEKFEKGELL